MHLNSNLYPNLYDKVEVKLRFSVIAVSAKSSKVPFDLTIVRIEGLFGKTYLYEI